MRLKRDEKRIVKVLEGSEHALSPDALRQEAGLSTERFTLALKNLKLAGLVGTIITGDHLLTPAGKTRARESWLRSIAAQLILAVVIAVVSFWTGFFCQVLLTWWRADR